MRGSFLSRGIVAGQKPSEKSNSHKRFYPENTCKTYRILCSFRLYKRKQNHSVLFHARHDQALTYVYLSGEWDAHVLLSETNCGILFQEIVLQDYSREKLKRVGEDR